MKMRLGSRTFLRSLPDTYHSVFQMLFAALVAGRKTVTMRTVVRGSWRTPQRNSGRSVHLKRT